MTLRLRALLTAVGAALASLALLAAAAQATPPAPPYEDFAGCPSPAEDETVAECFKIDFTGGHVQLGKRDVPIANPFALRGGTRFLTGDFAGNSEAGIPPVSQPVPGGLVGLTGLTWLDEALSAKALKLNASIELAGEPGSLEVLPFSLPVKVHLENPFLGKNCYVGSSTNPIQLHIGPETTSPPPPNKPITGKALGEFGPEAGRPEVFAATGGVFVDNAYAVPGAGGCQLNLGSLHIGIDNLVDSAYGLAAAAGTNETVLDVGISVVLPGVVYP